MKLQEGETVLHELRPGRAVLGVWFFSKALIAALVGSFLIFWCIGFFGSLYGQATGVKQTDLLASSFQIGLLSFSVFLPVGFLYCMFLRGTYRFYITDQRCLIEGGILRWISRSAPYHKITEVEFSKNLLERLLGIESITVATASTVTHWHVFGENRANLTFSGLRDCRGSLETINEFVRKTKRSSCE